MDNSKQQTTATVEQIVKPNVVEKTATTVESAKVKKADAAKAKAPEPKVPSITVNFKIAADGINGKTALPEDQKFKVNDTRGEILLHPLFVSVINGILNGNKLDKPVIIPRKSILNKFCITNKLTPINCKKENKTENATVATYGVVPLFTDTIKSADQNVYRLFGFLRYPLIETKNWVAVKYGTYLIVMSLKMYADLKAGTLTADEDVILVG
jgi:hypothetical protein